MGMRNALFLAGLGAASMLAVAWWLFGRAAAGVLAAFRSDDTIAGAGAIEASLIEPGAAPDTRREGGVGAAASAAPRGSRLVGRVVNDRDGRGLSGAWLALWLD